MDKRLDGRIETLRRMRAAMAAKEAGEFGEPELVDGPPPITGEFGEITLADEQPQPPSKLMEMDPLYIEGRVPKSEPDMGALAKLSPEQVDAVNKFASERAKPMESASKFSDIPQVSSEDRSRRMLEQARRQSNNDDGMAMIQQGGREIGDAIAGNKSDKWLYNTLSEQAQRPLAQLELDQAKSAASASDRAKRDQAVRQWTLEQQAKKDEGAAKLLAAEKANAEEVRRRGEDRGFKVGDEADKRKWEAGQSAMDRASRERAATNSAGSKAAKEDDDQVEKLGKQLPPGAAGFYEQLDSINAIMNKPGNEKDKPGVGFWDSRKPDFLQSAEGMELQKNAKQMMLAYRNLVTGTGGGEAEMAQIDKAGADLGNEASFKKGLEALERGYTARLKQVYGGYKPSAVETYQKRVPSLTPREGGKAPVNGQHNLSGKVTVSNGAETLEIDPADLADAERDGFKRIK